MQVDVVEDAQGPWLRVRGPLDFAEAQALVKAGVALLRAGDRGPLRLDLAGVSFLDASGLAAQLHKPSGPVRQTLRLTRLDQAFRLHHESSCEGALRDD